MTEKPTKRRMSSFGPDEPSVNSLKNELSFLKQRQVTREREFCVIQNKYTKNVNRIEKENGALKRERFGLREKLQRTEDALSISILEVEHRDQELKRLRDVEKRVRELEEALAVNPDANLRLMIKHLLVKYHPDKQRPETLPLDSETVTRDLLGLLE